jgi:membrane-associated phospholipid phosphatase
MVSVGMSHVFARRIHNPYVKVVCYGMGAIGSWSRLYSSAHWASDVALGGALAVFSVEAVSAWYAEQKSDDRPDGKVGVQWRVIPTPRAVHLSVSW